MKRNFKKNDMRKLIIWYNIKSDKRYWFEIKIVYKNKEGDRLLDFHRMIGFTHKSYILIARKVLKLFPLHKEKWIPKKCLCNGTVYYEVNCYLGYFKNPNK